MPYFIYSILVGYIFLKILIDINNDIKQILLYNSAVDTVQFQIFYSFNFSSLPFI